MFCSNVLSDDYEIIFDMRLHKPKAIEFNILKVKLMVRKLHIWMERYFI